MSVSSNIHDENSRNLLRKEVPCDGEIESPMDDEEFPTTSIRVLLVDEDSNSLLLMENLMRQYSYQVTKYENGEEAIDFLMKSKHEIDLVIWDFHMPDINVVDALNTIGKDMDLPVVIMSHGYKKETVMKSTKFGACDFLVKPVSKEIIAVLWRHVFCKRLSKSGLDKPDESDTVESIPDEDETLRQEKYNDLCQSNEEGSKNTSDRKRKKSSPKKPRMAWTTELHHKFEVAVEKIGSVDKAFPKQILKYMQEEMNVQGLTRNNVASHLQRLRWQKYRLNVNNKQTRTPQETQEDSGWRNAGPNAALAASNPLLNSSINQDARASYFMNDRAVVNAPPIQYSSNSYLPMNNHYYIPNPLPYIDQYQQRQQQFYSSLQLPPLLTKQESGHVSYTMENSDPLIYNTPTLSDLHECFNFDQIGR